MTPVDNIERARIYECQAWHPLERLARLAERVEPMLMTALATVATWGGGIGDGEVMRAAKIWSAKREQAREEGGW